MELILLGVGAYYMIKCKQKKDFEGKLLSFYNTMKRAEREEEISHCVVLDGSNIYRYGMSNYEYDLPFSWKSIKSTIFDRFEKQFPNWSDQSDSDIKNGVVSRVFTVYRSKNFHIKIETKVHRPIMFKTELKPYHEIDKIKIFYLM